MLARDSPSVGVLRDPTSAVPKGLSSSGLDQSYLFPSVRVHSPLIGCSSPPLFSSLVLLEEIGFLIPFPNIIFHMIHRPSCPEVQFGLRRSVLLLLKRKLPFLTHPLFPLSNSFTFPPGDCKIQPPPDPLTPPTSPGKLSKIRPPLPFPSSHFSPCISPIFRKPKMVGFFYSPQPPSFFTANDFFLRPLRDPAASVESQFILAFKVLRLLPFSAVASL